MLGESLHLSSKYLAQEAKVEPALSRVAVLETENSKLKKELITVMGEANLAKEKKAKTLSDDLRAERQLTVEKDKQLLQIVQMSKFFFTLDEHIIHIHLHIPANLLVEHLVH